MANRTVDTCCITTMPTPVLSRPYAWTDSKESLHAMLRQVHRSWAVRALKGSRSTERLAAVALRRLHWCSCLVHALVSHLKCGRKTHRLTSHTRIMSLRSSLSASACIFPRMTPTQVALQHPLLPCHVCVWPHTSTISLTVNHHQSINECGLMATDCPRAIVHVQHRLSTPFESSHSSREGNPQCAHQCLLSLSTTRHTR